MEMVNLNDLNILILISAGDNAGNIKLVDHSVII